MERKVGVLLIHGLGEHSDDYAHDTIQHLKERISGKGLNREEVAWESVYWRPVLSDREQQLWVDLSAGHDLNWVKQRKFLITAFGSATTYLSKGDHSYQQMYDKVHQSLVSLQEKLRGENKPLIVMAHSLGAMIVSDYIWDRQVRREEAKYGRTPFERMETLCGLVTFGANIPLFALAYHIMASIKFPPAQLPENLRRQAKWINLYDPDDVLGWPLKTLNASYRESVTEDIEIRVENILNSWNLVTHAKAYWGDENFIRPVADLLAGVLGQVK